jgi:hypothetical protein
VLYLGMFLTVHPMAPEIQFQGDCDPLSICGYAVQVPV